MPAQFESSLRTAERSLIVRGSRVALNTLRSLPALEDSITAGSPIAKSVPQTSAAVRAHSRSIFDNRRGPSLRYNAKQKAGVIRGKRPPRTANGIVHCCKPVDARASIECEKLHIGIERPNRDAIQAISAAFLISTNQEPAGEHCDIIRV
jgi:hypothetical protein